MAIDKELNKTSDMIIADRESKENILKTLSSSLEAYNTAILEKNKKSMKAGKRSLIDIQGTIDKSGILGKKEKEKYAKLIKSSVTKSKHNDNMAKRILKSSGDMIKNALPNKDMLLGAIASQNPMAALSINVIRGLLSKREKQTSNNITGSISEVEKDLEKLNEKIPNNKNISDTVSPVKVELEKQGETLNLHTDLLDGIHDLLDLANKQKADEIRKNERLRLQSLERMDESKLSVVGKTALKKTKFDAKKDSGGILTGFVDTIFDIAKIGAGAFGAGLLIKFKAFASFFKNFGSIIGRYAKLGKLLGPLGIAITGIIAIKDFFSGFLNPEKILGDNASTFTDRISAGIGSLLGGISSIIDGVASLFGFNPQIGKFVEKNISKISKSFFDYMKNVFQTTTIWIKNQIKKIPIIGKKIAKKIETPKISKTPMIEADGLPETHGKSLKGTDPELLRRLRQAELDYEKQTGKDIKFNVTSAYRSKEEQAKLRQLYLMGRGAPAARPGTSKHETGEALDISSKQLNELNRLGLLEKYGLKRPYDHEPWHLEKDKSFRRKSIDLMNQDKTNKEMEKTKAEKSKEKVNLNNINTNNVSNTTNLTPTEMQIFNPDGSFRYRAM